MKTVFLLQNSPFWIIHRNCEHTSLPFVSMHAKEIIWYRDISYEWAMFALRALWCFVCSPQRNKTWPFPCDSSSRTGSLQQKILILILGDLKFFGVRQTVNSARDTLRDGRIQVVTGTVASLWMHAGVERNHDRRCLPPNEMIEVLYLVASTTLNRSPPVFETILNKRLHSKPNCHAECASPVPRFVRYDRSIVPSAAVLA